MTARLLVSAAGILLAIAGPSFANNNTDYPVRGNWLWQLGWQRWPAVQPSTAVAPWYVWWPANANETLNIHDFQSSPYPTWPAQGHPGAGMVRPQGPTAVAPQPAPWQSVPVRPVANPQPPNYPYGR